MVRDAAIDDDLCVPGYNGQDSRWYQAAVRQQTGRIIGGVYLNAVVGACAGSATVRIMPHNTGE